MSQSRLYWFSESTARLAVMDDGLVIGAPLPAAARERGDANSLQAALRRELASGRWQEGDRLPTEREFGERYGLARNTVRRALQDLETEGLIIRHVGRGTFKAGASITPTASEFRGIEGASPADVLECRLVFEPGLAPLVVARASHADLDRMDECLRGADAAKDVAGFEAADAAFHDAIAVATHNQTVIAVARTLARVRLQAEWGQLKAQSMTSERKAALQVEHRAIVEAFRRRDRADAGARLREHILHVQAYMFGE
jgi:DNA-binding FadR family transcriptional regulator